MNPFIIHHSKGYHVGYVMARCWLDARDYTQANHPQCLVTAVEALPPNLNSRDIPQAPFRPTDYERSVDTADLHRKEGRNQVRELIKQRMMGASTIHYHRAYEALLKEMDVVGL